MKNKEITKQEEIREGLTLLMSECYSKELSVCPNFLPQVFLNRLYSYLHSKGVVIKVDRELPFTDPYGTCLAEVNALNILIESGYVAVESLINEKD